MRIIFTTAQLTAECSIVTLVSVDILVQKKKKTIFIDYELSIIKQ